MKRIWMMALVALALWARSSQAMPSVDGQSMLSEAGFSFVIETGDNPVSREVCFPAVERKAGHTVCLAFRMYLRSPWPGGWNPLTAWELNGVPMKKTTAGNRWRLLGRGEAMFTTLKGSERLEWWRGNQLMTLFGPGSGEVDKRIAAPRECGYDYLLDISDLVHYVEPGADGRVEAAVENRLKLTNLMLKRWAPKDRTIDLVVEGLRVVQMPEAEVEKRRPAEQPIAFSPSKAAARLASSAGSVTVTEAGGAVVEVQGERYYLESAFSYPARPAMRFNRLGVGAGAGAEKTWRPKVRQVDGATAEVVATGAGYRVTQRLSLQGDALSIQTTVKNLGKDALGCQVTQLLGTPGLLKAGQWLLGGNDDQEKADGLGSNPTVMTAQERSALGLVAEDEATRNHIVAERRNNTVSMHEPNVGIPGGAEATLEYTLYLLPSPDYFALVNRVRRAWGVNQRLVGPFCFGAPPPGLECAVAALPPWVEYAWKPGKRLTREQYRAQLQKEIAALRKSHPGITLLAMCECNLVTIDKGDVPGGERLPKTGKVCEGVYGYLMSHEQSRLLAAHPLADSMLRSKDGRIYVDTFYPAEPCLDLQVQIEKGNGRFRQAMEQFTWLTTEVGFDGIYFDQFAPGCNGGVHRKDRCSFDRWDGRTVILAQDGTIAEKLYDYAVTGTSGRVELIQGLLKRGKFFVANTQPITKATAVAGTMRFMEMESDNIAPILAATGRPPLCRQELMCQLSCAPIALGIRPPRYSADPKERARLLHRAVILGLRHGVVYYLYNKWVDLKVGGYGIISKMFPITPVELGEGFVVGKERILTAVTRGFVTASKPKAVHVFDPHGRERSGEAETVQVPGGWRTTVKLADWQESAAIILE